jgi:hypothetical protein
MLDETISLREELSLYLQHGFSIIPVKPGNKLPDGSWLHAQTQRAGLADVMQWQMDGMSFGVVTGQISGLVVVDCDSDAAVREVARRGMPITPVSTTGRGRHYWLKYPGVIRNRVALGEGIDVRGDGGFVVAPPSVHANGRSYRWVPGLSLGEVPLAECPAWLLEGERQARQARGGDEWWSLFDERVRNGGRNNRCAQLAGYLLRKRVEARMVEALLQMWNVGRCSPPMSGGEVRMVVASIAAKEARRSQPS